MKKKTSKEILFERFEKVDPTFKKKINEEAPIEPDENGEEITIEPQEHGEEGANYKAKLECIVDKAQKIYEGLPEGEIPHWVQDKITIAEEHLKSIYGWMHGEEEEQEGEIEGSNREMDVEELSEKDNQPKPDYEYREENKELYDLVNHIFNNMDSISRREVFDMINNLIKNN